MKSVKLNSYLESRESYHVNKIEDRRQNPVFRTILNYKNKFYVLFSEFWLPNQSENIFNFKLWFCAFSFKFLVNN